MAFISMLDISIVVHDIFVVFHANTSYYFVISPLYSSSKAELIFLTHFGYFVRISLISSKTLNPDLAISNYSTSFSLASPPTIFSNSDLLSSNQEFDS